MKLWAIIVILLVFLSFGILLKTRSQENSVELPPPAVIVSHHASTDPHALRILCFGDSITAGAGDVRHHGGYRSKLMEMLAPKLIVFVGTQKNGFEADAGYSGYTTWALIPKAEQEASRAKPNLILLLAGTNDAAYGSDHTRESTQLALEGETQLIQVLHRSAPNAKIFVASTPPQDPTYDRGDLQMLSEFNRALPALVTSLQSQKLPVQFVDMFQSAGISPSDLFDKIHPNERGYTKMAVQWAKAINTHS